MTDPAPRPDERPDARPADHRAPRPHDPRDDAGAALGGPVEIPFWQRLSTRLTLLILVVVGVLAMATTVLLVRGLTNAQQGALDVLQQFVQQPAGPGGVDPSAAEQAERAVDVSGIVRGTLINLVAIFLLTLVGAAVFSRTLLTEPIEQLTRATRELASGRRVRLPVTSSSELGVLATSFNHMADAVAESRETLAQRVEERTAELQALLALSNTIAVTLELHPLLEQILDQLEGSAGFARAVVFEAAPFEAAPGAADGGSEQAELRRLMRRGAGTGAPGVPDEAAGVDAVRAALRERREIHRLERRNGAGGASGAAGANGSGSTLALPLLVRNKLVGALLLQHPDAKHFGEERRRLARAFAAQAAIAMENVRLYESATEKAAYDERQHLARELHDSVSQALYAILLGTHTAQRQLERSPEKTAGALAYVESLAQAGIAEMRALIFELRPESLEQEGLVGVLRKQVDALETRHALDVVATLGDEPDIPFASKQVLLRVAQEALHNVVKHARATRVRLELQTEPAADDPADLSALRLRVIDDGIGFDADGDFPGHLGLTSMRERVGALGGSLEIVSAPGAGTTVTARLPLHGTEPLASATEGEASSQDARESTQASTVEGVEGAIGGDAAGKTRPPAPRERA